MLDAKQTVIGVAGAILAVGPQIADALDMLPWKWLKIPSMIVGGLMAFASNGKAVAVVGSILSVVVRIWRWIVPLKEPPTDPIQPPVDPTLPQLPAPSDIVLPSVSVNVPVSVDNYEDIVKELELTIAIVKLIAEKNRK